MAKFTGESCKCAPRQSESPFLGNWGDLDGGSGEFSSCSKCFEGDERLKKSSTFRGRKSAPRENAGYAYAAKLKTKHKHNKATRRTARRLIGSVRTECDVGYSLRRRRDSRQTVVSVCVYIC